MNTETTEAAPGAQWLVEREALQQRVIELEAQLAEAHANLGRQLRFTEALLAAIPTPVFFKDAQGRYLGCNDAFTEQTGVSAAEMKGKTVHDLWPGEHAEFYHQKDGELLQCPQRQAYEFVIRDKNGADRNVIFAKGAFYDETGQVAGLVGAYVDITERKQAEEALRASEGRCRSLIEHSNDAIYILYGNQFEMINPRFEALFGVTAEEVRAPDFDFMTLVAPSSRPLIAARLRSLQAGEAAPLRYEFTALTRARQEIEVEVSVSHIAYRDGFATQGILRDISERKRMEQALRESEERYKSLYQMFRLMADSMADFLWAKDMEGRFTFVNQAICAHFLNARDTDEPLGKTDMFFAERERQAHPDNPQWHTFGELCIKSDEAVIHSRKPGCFEESGYVQGQYLHLDVHKAPIWNEQGEMIGTVGSSRTITHEKELERERAQAIAALQESERRFHELADLLPQVVSETDVNGNLIYVNRMAFDMFGYTPQDLEQGLNVFQMLAPEERERAARAFQEDITGSVAERGHEYCALRKDGSTFPVLIYTSPIISDGQVTGLRGLVVDITERRQAEQAQQQLLERMRQQQTAVVALSLHPAFVAGDVDAAAQFLTETVAEVMDVARVSVWLFDDEGTVIRCHNMYLCSQDAHHSGQVLAVADFPAYFTALKQGRAIAAQDVRPDPHTSDLAETYLVPNGITSMLGATLRLHGQVVGVICHEHVGEPRAWQPDEIVFTEQVADQIAQALANAERRRDQERLRASEEKYRSLVEQSIQGVIVAQDNPVRLRFASQPMQAICGFSPQELTSFTPQQLPMLIHPEDREVFFRNFRARLTGKPVPQRHEYRIIHKDGDVRWVEVYSTLIEYEGTPATQTVFLDITERIQAQTALREREAYFRVLFEYAGDAIFISNDEDRILDANRRVSELLGYTREELLHMTIADIQAPERRGKVGSIIREELAKYGGQPFETLDLRKDGTCVPVEVMAVRLETTQGNLALGIVRDISERVRAQRALQRERDLFSALAEAAAAVSRTLDPDEVLDYLLEQVSRVIPNDATNIMLIEPDRRVRVARWRGYERFGIEEFIDSLVYDLDQVPNLLRMEETGEPTVIADTETYPGWVHAPEQSWLRAYVGAPIRMRNTVIGFLSADSATPGFFTALHANILRAFANHAAVALENARLYHAAQQELTERKRAESALHESEERYRRLFERSNDAIFLVDRFTGQYKEANEAAERLTGRSMAELQQLTALVVAPEGAEERLAQMQTTVRNLEMGEVHYLRPDGVSRTALLDIVPLNDQTVFSIARDITENKEIEERLRRQERLAAIGQLAAGIAHDFRNLLTTIILYAQLGHRRPDLSPTVAHYLEIIVAEAHKATDLVKQILDFSRRTEIERRPLDLVGLVGNVIAVLQRTLPENIHIVLDIGAGPCIIEGDAGRLQQVLTNLALNARDAMPDGGTLRIGVTRITAKPGVAPPLPAMVEALAPPAWICLSVTDTGIGMTEEAYAHLFEPFFTTKEEGKGTGLGLAQVYGIIRLHAGYIDVETVVQQGATFRIYLPASTLTTESDAENITTTPTGHGETLLLVEDNTSLREAGQNLLTALGYRVLTAADGREALAIYQTEEKIALLITDLVMPELGGKALMQALRDLDPSLKALVMTGYTTQESTESLRAAGFLEVIRKPFDADSLAWVVHRALSA
jgi:two-component system cell cycle sensor histidine kinase/response regulator CckA